jgi:organic hydroperoxide reductase OsmC/OhrA
MATHTYRSTLSWRGSTGVGYKRYDRTHRLSTPPAERALTMSGDTAFGGDGRLMNPEGLLLAAASSCQMLSFLALAARSRVDVLAYDDEAEALMPEDDEPVRITQITLRPRIQVAAGSNLDRAHRLVDKAHDTCYVANSLRTEIEIEASISEAEAH